MSTKSTCVLIAATAGVALLAGCERQKPAVVQYDLPKLPRASGVADAPAAPMKTGTMSAAAPADAGRTAMMNDSSGLASQTADIVAPVWTVPAGWKDKPAGAIRKGSWLAEGADVYVIGLPNDSGGLRANIGRWCGQAGLPVPASKDEADKYVATGVVGGRPATRVDIAGAKKALTVVIVENAGVWWFFKAEGAPADVEKAKPAFDAFMGSVKFPSAK